jgi:hypothetical protein
VVVGSKKRGAYRWMKMHHTPDICQGLIVKYQHFGCFHPPS